MLIWRPDPSLRLASALVGFAALGVGAWLIGLAAIHGEWAGVALVALLCGVMAGQALGVAFYVKLRFDGQRLIYSSVHPWAVPKSEIGSIRVTRYGNLSTVGMPILSVMDGQGGVLRSATCAWSDPQVSEITRALGAQLDRG